MCITPEEIRKIVHQELDDKLVHFMETVNESIDTRMSHMESSPQTRKEIEAIKSALAQHDSDERLHWAKIDEMLEFQKESSEAINAVKDLLAGGRVLRGVAQAMVWVGAVAAGLVGFKVWILDK